MPSFILTYDLVAEESSEAYKPLLKDLRDRGAHCYQQSSWLISLNNTADDVHDHFRQFMDADDKLFVAELVRNHKQTRNYQGTNDWIANHQPGR